MEFLQTHKCHCFCCSTHSERSPRGARRQSHLQKNQTVNCLTYEKITIKPYNVNMCLFRALALHLHGSRGLEDETSERFTLLLQKVGGTNPASFQGVCMKDVSVIEYCVRVSIFLYDVDFIDGATIGEIVRRSVGRHSKTVRLSLYSSHICYVFKIKALFEACCCPSCDQFINKAGNLERHLTTCQELVKQISPKTCISSAKHCLTKLTRSVSLIQTTKLCSTAWQILNLNQSVWQMKISKIPKQQHGLGNTLQFLNSYCPSWYRYPFYYAILILVTWYHLSLMLWKRPTILLRKKFVEVHRLDHLKVLGGATNLDSILKAYKTSQTKGFVPYVWFNHRDKEETTKNFLLTKPFTTNYEISTLLKKSI